MIWWFHVRKGESNLPRVGKEKRKKPGYSSVFNWKHYLGNRVRNLWIFGFHRKGVCRINRTVGMYGKVPVKTRKNTWLMLPFQVRQIQLKPEFCLRGTSGTILHPWVLNFDPFKNSGLKLEIGPGRCWDFDPHLSSRVSLHSHKVPVGELEKPGAGC